MPISTNLGLTPKLEVLGSVAQPSTPQPTLHRQCDILVASKTILELDSLNEYHFETWWIPIWNLITPKLNVDLRLVRTNPARHLHPPNKLRSWTGQFISGGQARVWSILVFFKWGQSRRDRVLLLLAAQVGWRTFCDWKYDRLKDMLRTRHWSGPGPRWLRR